MKEIEKIQKRATKLVIKLQNKSYTDIVRYSKIYRRLRGDTIEVFKITHNIGLYTTQQYHLIFLSMKELTPEAIL